MRFSEINVGIQEKAYGDADVYADEVSRNEPEVDYTGKENIEEAVCCRGGGSYRDVHRRLPERFFLRFSHFVPASLSNARTGHERPGNRDQLCDN